MEMNAKKEELLANEKDIDKYAMILKQKVNKFLSLGGLYKALIGEREILVIHNLMIIILWWISDYIS